MSKLKHRLVLAVKKCFFARRGEPYLVGDNKLYFVPGTRPVRLRYRTSDNAINRYDAMQLDWMLDNLAEGNFAIDVGANCGQCTIVMAKLCGASGNVVAFEPNPSARNVLNRNFDLNPHIKRATIESAACSNITSGEVELYQNGNASNSALVPFAAGNDLGDPPKSFRVPVTTLDSYIAERQLPELRLLKIDTEGAEIRILKGARNVLASRTAILCELHPYAWRQFGNSLQELKDLAAQCGRRIRYLDQGSEIGETADYGIVALEHLQ
jgi:FkbM family methyltransferase